MMTPSRDEQGESRELVSALFGLITARLEDAAAMAAIGQNRRMPRAEIVDITSQIMSSADQVGILLRAAIAVLPD